MEKMITGFFLLIETLQKSIVDIAVCFYFVVSGVDTMKSAVSAAATTISVPTICSRLVVVTGIDTSLSAGTVEAQLRRVCNSHGGLYKDSFYMPIRQVSKVHHFLDYTDVYLFQSFCSHVFLT